MCCTTATVSAQHSDSSLDFPPWRSQSSVSSVTVFLIYSFIQQPSSSEPLQLLWHWGKNNTDVSRNRQETDLGWSCIVLWCNVCNSCSNPHFSWWFFRCYEFCKGVSDKNTKYLNKSSYEKSQTYQGSSQLLLQWFFPIYKGGRSVCHLCAAHRMPKFDFTSTYSPIHNIWITYAISLLFFSLLT